MNQTYLDEAAERLGGGKLSVPQYLYSFSFVLFSSNTHLASSTISFSTTLYPFAAVRILTQSYDDLGSSTDPRYSPLLDFHSYLESTYSLIHSHSTLKKHNTYSLIYTFQGSDPSLRPAILAAHQDVVPAINDTTWKYPPFSGFYEKETGLVWGKGSSDDKSMLISIMNAWEQLLREGFKNQRTWILAFGLDEEISGPEGAVKMGEYFEKEFGGEGIECESSILLLGKSALLTLFRPPLVSSYHRRRWPRTSNSSNKNIAVALPAIGEKVYTDVILTLTTQGGHSSMPPAHTGIGIISSILKDLGDNPHEPNLSTRNPILVHLICLAERLDQIESQSSDSWNLLKESTDPPLKQIECFKMTKKMRLDIKKPSRWNWIAKEVSKKGSKEERFDLQTSQAIDIIHGGLKANALPETTQVTINHRINVDSVVKEVHERLERVVRVGAEKFGVEVFGFGEDERGIEVGNGILKESDDFQC